MLGIPFATSHNMPQYCTSPLVTQELSATVINCILTKTDYKSNSQTLH